MYMKGDCYSTFVRLFTILVCCLFFSSCRNCCSFPEDNVKIPGESGQLNTISFCFYRSGYYGEALSILDFVGLGWLEKPQFGGLVVRSLRDDQTLKHDICVSSRIGSQIALQFSKGKVYMWSNLEDDPPKWRIVKSLNDNNNSLEMYSLLMSISLMEAFKNGISFDQETNYLYQKVKQMVYSYYSINCLEYENMLRVNESVYHEMFPDSRLYRRDNIYQIFMYPSHQNTFEESINRDYKKINGVELPHHKNSFRFWDSNYCSL